MALVPQQRKAVTASVPAPIGGWNARDSLAAMQPTDAVQMVNWYPTPSDILLRRGYSQHSTGITGTVESLMNYASPTGQKLFSVANGVIYNSTATGAATSVFTGLTNSKFQHVNISTPGGSFLVACNGADPTMVYDGTHWFKIATTATAQTISTITRGGTGNLTATLTTASAHGLITGNRVTISGADPTQFNGTYVITVTGTTTFTYTMASAPAGDATTMGSYTVVGITGVNSNTFINVNLFKNRLWFTEKDTMKVWYLDPESIGGDANPLDFASIARMGGYLQAMGTWTIDAGEGVDDYAVFVTNMGEIIVYNGTDPNDATKWLLKGVWQVGQTFNRRCFFKWSGDLLLLTQDGLLPLASALQSSRLDPRVALTDKIYYAVSQAADFYSTNFGWQINYFAKQNMLILNIPVTEGSEQYVMHTITKSWARFTNINADCWEIHNDDMYFGGSGYVGQFWSSDSDNGNNINATVQQAYNYFDTRGTQKRFTLVRPIITTIGGFPSILCGVNLDFEEGNATGTISFNPSGNGNGVWDSSTWDNAIWGGATVINKNWQGVTGIGYCASLQLTAASQGITVRWASTDFVMETGGVI
jgi:hypothetical protein